jgi:hypothetical protein
VAILDHGRVLESGTVDALRAGHGGDLEAAFIALTGREIRD